MKSIRLILMTLALLQLASCTTISTTSSGNVGVNRKQYVGLVTEEEAVQQSALAYQQTVKDAQAKKLLNTDSAETRRVRNIANKLIAHVGVFRPDAPNWKWEVNVQESKEINAYCMAGGKIMVYTGLLDQIKPTDDELAAVMGHEIAHALREHVRERMSRAKAQQYGLLGLAAVVGLSSKNADNALQTLALGGTVAALALTLPNSRTAEHEADQIGLELAARAGYDPNAALSLWQKMSAVGGEKPPEILSTHPSDESRMADIKRLIPAVMPLYEQAKKQRQ
ncbi:M48 family metallopeptidase [Methylobacillus flagellatus]|uniref:Peptidase M48, Ste24p n=1 Tax=Methylobacillus flagellatus (strain ATCC 51484 / DSM 6875 / VKM B-1610 / KT) TaxID=265072 RepID=Q1H055_METFK|nr:M48 family metallopeptidase [Methylobacillus flagellatus]ABE50132.1 peptidase M48, Ste24p [Methylobacillus flagellatus KT]